MKARNKGLFSSANILTASRPEGLTQVMLGKDADW